jgi:hypothetical protein
MEKDCVPSPSDCLYIASEEKEVKPSESATGRMAALDAAETLASLSQLTPPSSTKNSPQFLLLSPLNSGHKESPGTSAYSPDVTASFVKGTRIQLTSVSSLQAYAKMQVCFPTLKRSLWPDHE